LGAVGVVAAWCAASILGRGPSVKPFLTVPLATCGVVLLLGVWQLIDRRRRGDLVMRLVGLVMVLAALAMFAQALGVKIRYFQEITIIGVLLGGVLAVFGYQVFRVAWVALAFLYLAIPWPERTYVDMAIIPQKWAAGMAVRFMQLLYGPTVMQEGTVVVVGPTLDDRLTVAEQCSGLQMLFAFVALSVVYAYISRRPAWRRVVIFVSSFPIAVLANFARVTIMALCYRLGFKEVTQGLTHEMAGFVIMLPLAFLLLYVEMRLLDLGEKLAAILAGEDKSAGGSASRPPDETAVPGGAA
jgi:exosortase